MYRVIILYLFLVATCVYGDMYLHNPRGSNDRLNEASTNRDNNNRMFDSQNNAKGGYAYGPPMHYYVGSKLEIEWTNQHGCSIPNMHCEVVLQYMCGDKVRDGVTTETIPDDNNTYNLNVTNPEPGYFFPNDIDGQEVVYRYGMHESYEYYQDCKSRSRNRGLFIADRNVGGSARSTRQNNGGGRSGFECPEERDYYPYWHPNPWIDIAILTSKPSRCSTYIGNSGNTRRKNYCSINIYNNEAECINGGGTWESVPANGGGTPDCKGTLFSRDNHLGNGDNGNANRYSWIIPDDTNEHCVFRIRYNISTGDYKGWGTDSDKNGIASPIKNDPKMPYGYDNDNSSFIRNLTLAIDTSQFGRTFQDRSHTFAIRGRSGFGPLDRVFNLNVRGKRGNIVQTYPAVEYDFIPTDLDVRQYDHIHFQWTGSNNNPQGNDGEGRAGTDRSNWVEIKSRSVNKIGEFDDGSLLGSGDRYLFAHLNQTNCQSYEELLLEHGNDANAIANDPENCMILNAASPYFNGGVLKVDTTGTFHYMSTRNNNFSNRSQKGSISVEPFLPVWAIVLVVFAGTVCLFAIAVSITGFTARLLPNTKFGQVWKKINFIKDADSSPSSEPSSSGVDPDASPDS